MEPAVREAAPAVATRPPSFVEIYESLFDFVWRSALRLGVAEAAADDAVQDVFIVVHRRLADFEGRSTIKSWVFGIVRRVAKDYRRRAERKDRGKVTTDGLIDETAPDPSELSARAEARTVLHQLLDKLDEQKREVFVLSELEQMTVPEIADAIHANINTVYSRLRAARREFEAAVDRLHARERSLGS